MSSTATRIRMADKELLERIAKTRDWTQMSTLTRAIRILAEAEQIDVADGDAPTSGPKNPDLSKDREPVGV